MGCLYYKLAEGERRSCENRGPIGADGKGNGEVCPRPQPTRGSKVAKRWKRGAEDAETNAEGMRIDAP